jgi:iron complex transport system ATP-binding protein
VARLDRRALARRICYLPQQVQGFGGFRVREVVESGRYPYLRPFAAPTVEDREQVEQALETCRVTHLSARLLDTLSGGEQQKVWLAAALAQQSPVLLLDEPTTALDPRHFAELMDTLVGLREAGKTLLIVSHDLDVPVLLDCRVLGLREGRLLADLPVKEYFADRHLEELFDCTFDRLVGAAGVIRLRPGSGGP